MTVYIPYGLIAILLSLYIFSAIRRKRTERLEEKRHHAQSIRQSLLDKTLGHSSSSIILYDPFIDAKISRLQPVHEGDHPAGQYYRDPENEDVWVLEPIPDDSEYEGERQLRKLDRD